CAAADTRNGRRRQLVTSKSCFGAAKEVANGESRQRIVYIIEPNQPLHLTGRVVTGINRSRSLWPAPQVNVSVRRNQESLPRGVHQWLSSFASTVGGTPSARSSKRGKAPASCADRCSSGKRPATGPETEPVAREPNQGPHRTPAPP